MTPMRNHLVAKFHIGQVVRHRIYPFRGVIFDVGHGAGSFWFRIAVPAIQQGFLPDTISTDIHKGSIMIPNATLTNVMSKFLNIGMTLHQVIERTTVNAAKAIRRYDLGNLDEGAVADIAVLEFEEGEFAFMDSGRAKHIGNQLRPEADAEHAPAGGDGPFDEALLVHQPGVVSLFVNVHGAAQHHQQIHRVDAWQGIATVEARCAECVPTAPNPLLDASESFERHVLQIMDVHRVPPCPALTFRRACFSPRSGLSRSYTRGYETGCPSETSATEEMTSGPFPPSLW